MRRPRMTLLILLATASLLVWLTVLASQPSRIVRIEYLDEVHGSPPWGRVAPEQAAEAKKYGVQLTFQNDIGMRFVLIPAGSFVMGSPVHEANREDWKHRGILSNETQHQVTLSEPFYMQITEVTNAQYRQFRPDHNSGDWGETSFGADKGPVVYISWDDAVAFTEWLRRQDRRRAYSLPTEAQWEYGCRAGSMTPFATGETIAASQANFRPGHARSPAAGLRDGPLVSRRGTTMVGSYPPNDWSLYDMHGNVQEWCRDWFGEYPTVAVVDPTGPEDGTLRVLRGGKWSHDFGLIRSAAREADSPEGGISTEGFRLVFPLPESSE